MRPARIYPRVRGRDAPAVVQERAQDAGLRGGRTRRRLERRARPPHPVRGRRRRLLLPREGRVGQQRRVHRHCERPLELFGKIQIVADYAIHHMSNKTRKFVKDNRHRLKVHYTPKYTPNDNPAEAMWVRIKDDPALLRCPPARLPADAPAPASDCDHPPPPSPLTASIAPASACNHSLPRLPFQHACPPSRFANVSDASPARAWQGAGPSARTRRRPGR